ncbi:MAG: helix-turn-helix domain-containing protein, partial [Planctomycetes bacterium]|nr:helix-turn-helix domain-containing protein [Planctomycetota bacterium]
PDEAKVEIRRLYDEGMIPAAIARQTGLSYSSVYRITKLLDLGFRSDIAYRDSLARQRGFESRLEYEQSLAQARGFRSLNEGAIDTTNATTSED